MKTDSVFVNFALLKEPVGFDHGFDQRQRDLLEAEPSSLFQKLVNPLSEFHDVIAYSTDLNERHEYEAATWCVDHDFAIADFHFAPDNSFGRHVEIVLDLIDENALMVFETRQSLVQALRDNGFDVFEIV